MLHDAHLPLITPLSTRIRSAKLDWPLVITMAAIIGAAGWWLL